MDFKGSHGRGCGFLVWFTSAVFIVVVLLGSQHVEGLECDICYHHFGNDLTSKCSRMPCDDFKDEENAWDEFEKKRAIAEAAGHSSRALGSRNYHKKQADAKAEFICMKGVGSKPTKGALKKFNTLQSKCMWAYEYPHLEPTKMDPYDGASIEVGEYMNEPDYLGFDVYICDNTNEAKCRATPEDLEREASPEPPPDDPSRGLECEVCIKIGEYGSQSCPLMSCNGGMDNSDGMKLIHEGIGDWMAAEVAEADSQLDVRAATATLRSMHLHTLNETRSAARRSNPAPELVCMKLVGTAETAKGRVPLTYFGCEESVPWFPPKNDPYKKLPDNEMKGFMDETLKLELEEMFICNVKNHETCRVHGRRRNDANSGAASTNPYLRERKGTGDGNGTDGDDAGDLDSEPNSSSRLGFLKHAASMAAVSSMSLVVLFM